MIQTPDKQHYRERMLHALTWLDWEAVDELIGDAADELGDEAAAMAFFRSDVLPRASVKVRRAFWQHAMTPEQFSSFIENMLGAVTSRLEAKGFQLGLDYSMAPGRVYVNDLAMAALCGYYTPAQMASLELVIATPSDQ